VDGDATADQAPNLVALSQDLEREGQDRLDLGGVGLQRQPAWVRDMAEEGMDAVTGDEGLSWRQRLAKLDQRGVEADLLLGLAKRRGGEVGVALVSAAPRKRDLSGVPAQVSPPFGEDEPGLVGPVEERQQDRCVNRLAAQMITCTVPPSTDQAAPLT
jgi:hypothetical protein